jgi:hypothetical protein
MEPEADVIVKINKDVNKMGLLYILNANQVIMLLDVAFVHLIAQKDGLILVFLAKNLFLRMEGESDIQCFMKIVLVLAILVRF